MESGSDTTILNLFQKEGKEEGIWSILDSHGNKKGEGSFKSGLMHGSWVFWGDQGGKSAGEFANDRKEGKWIFWDKNGKIINEIEFKNGMAMK